MSTVQEIKAAIETLSTNVANVALMAAEYAVAPPGASGGTAGAGWMPQN